jgi:PEP-CTERM motif
MNKTLLAVAAVAVAAFAPTIASAAIEEFQFNSADITATFSMDVVGGQAVNGGGELWSPYWAGPSSMTLVTLSTTDVHDLGGGSLSYRFGGGTDLIGDTAAPIDGSGLVFSVNTNPNLDVGFNLWSNNDGSFTGFIAGNSPAGGQPIIYLGETGAVASAAVPEASTWAMMLAGFGGLGFAAFYRSRRTSISALA